MPADRHSSGTLNKLRMGRFKPFSIRQGKTTTGTALSASHKANVTMPKSNKFDYTNRVNSGARLGQIIGGALQKEAEKVKAQAEKQVQKARKQSGDSNVSASDTISSTAHIIDLKAPSKDLGDEGVCALADGLEIALRSGDNLASLALEDLNLSGNGITTVSLARLAPVLRLAKFDLKTINLSGNEIKVESDLEAEQWELFLLAFRDCMKLRRLDLSGNTQLGSRALEVFARVHGAEAPVSPLAPGGESSTLSFISEDHHEDGNGDATLATGFGDLSSDMHSPMANAQLIKRRRGLRSIPYITLHNIGLDDAGAMWLSYVVEDHYYPNQLIDELNAINPESVIKTYQQDTNSRGMDCDDNKTVGKEGAQLLEKTENMRRQLLLDDGTNMTNSMLGDDHSSMLEDDDSDRRLSTDRRASKALPRDRRFSVRSIRTNDGGEHEATELESARKKIQRHIIAHDGARSVELWRAALTVLRTSRMLLYISPMEHRYRRDGTVFASSPTDVPGLPTVQPPTPNDSPVTSNLPASALTIDTFRAAAHAKDGEPSFESMLKARSGGRPSLSRAITEVTNTPSSPIQHQRPTHRKDAFSEGTKGETNMNSVTEKLKVLVVKEVEDPQCFVRYQDHVITSAAAEGRVFRDDTVACHLPQDVIERILGFVMDGREMKVLSPSQRRTAVLWGQKREKMAAEREWLRKDESAQVLMLLDGIDCLSYGL